MRVGGQTQAPHYELDENNAPVVKRLAAKGWLGRPFIFHYLWLHRVLSN